MKRLVTQLQAGAAPLGQHELSHGGMLGSHVAEQTPSLQTSHLRMRFRTRRGVDRPHCNFTVGCAAAGPLRSR